MPAERSGITPGRLPSTGDAKKEQRKGVSQQILTGSSNLRSDLGVGNEEWWEPRVTSLRGRCPKRAMVKRFYGW